MLLLFLNENDVVFLAGCSNLGNDNNRPCSEFKNILIEENEECLDISKMRKKQISKEFFICKWRHNSLQCLKMLDMNDQ